SMLKASDSPPRYTTTGHTQLPRASAPIVAATSHWLPSMGVAAGCRHPATSRVRAPPATDAATMAQVARGSFIARRPAWRASIPCRTVPGGAVPGRSVPGGAGPVAVVPGPAGPVVAVPGGAGPVAVVPGPAGPGPAVPVVAVPG